MHSAMLLLVSGLPGSGKSTLARAYVARYGGVHVNSDLVRAALNLRGRYAPENKATVYRAMFERTRALLEAGQDVVVDSTFFRVSIRAPYEALARRVGARLICVEVCASEATIRRRLAVSRPDSEADFTVYETIRDQYEPWAAAHLTLESDAQPVDVLVETLRRYILEHHDR